MTLPNRSDFSLKSKFNQFFEKDHNKTKFYVFLTVLGILVFLAIAFTAPFKKKEIAERYPKPPSEAAELQTSLLGWPNNKFGMYSYRDSESTNLTQELVNSSGGDWGWILFPMNVKDRDTTGWNITFDLLKTKHLIPIIQLTLDPSTIPSFDDIDQAADFLNSLSWPTKKRFVSAFNEVNAAEYWGNKIDPEDYAQVLDRFITSFRDRSGDFFLLNGALNPSAKTGKVTTNLGVQTEYLDIRDYLRRVETRIPRIFKRLDGWAVHTYPQPEYKGKPTDLTIPGETDGETGRNTMSSYKWELEILRKEYGVDLPIFITETGWPHREGTNPKSEWLDQNTVAQYYTSVFKDVYLPDPQVAAVIPFGMKVDQLDNFSFVSKTGVRYPQFEALKTLPKTAGSPPLPSVPPPGPVISSFNPISGANVGEEVFINGKDLGAPSGPVTIGDLGNTYGTVTIGNVAVTDFIRWGSNQIRFRVPAEAVSGKIKLKDLNNRESESSFNLNILKTMNLKSWLLQYVPPTNPEFDRKDFTKNILLPAMNKASRYRGYRDSSAPPALNYTLDYSDIKTENNPPPQTRYPSNSGTYDYGAMFTKYDLCNYAKANDIRAVFIWADGSGPYVGGMWESAITGNKGIPTNGALLPYCPDKTIAVYGLNYTRGLAEALESYGHHLESVFRYFNSQTSYAGWSDESSPQNPGLHGRGDSCGNDHNPPNARCEYDRGNPYGWQPEGCGTATSPASVLSDCRNWRPDGSGVKEPLDCSWWGCSGDGWFKWWMQNMPGSDNTLVASNGQKIPNWWVYIGNPDNCYNKAVECSNFTTIPPSPSPSPSSPKITVLSPNGNEQLSSGQTFRIKWSVESISGSANIFYMTPARQATQVTNNADSSTGFYDWTVPNVSSVSSYKILIQSNQSGSIFDESDNTFTVNPSTQPPLKIDSSTYPNSAIVSLTPPSGSKTPLASGIVALTLITRNVNRSGFDEVGIAAVLKGLIPERTYFVYLCHRDLSACTSNVIPEVKTDSSGAATVKGIVFAHNKTNYAENVITVVEKPAGGPLPSNSCNFTSSPCLSKNILELTKLFPAPISTGALSLTIQPRGVVESTSAAITWKTNLDSSSQIEYGLYDLELKSTPEADVTTKVQDHTVKVSDLRPCFTYTFRVRSKDGDNALLVSNFATFTTKGCTATELGGTGNIISVSSGGATILKESKTGKGATLKIPPGFGKQDSAFQMKQLSKSTFIADIPLPTKTTTVVGDHIYSFKALEDPSTEIKTFNKEIEVEMKYIPEELSGIDEKTLKIIRWDGTKWNNLTDCKVDTTAKTVTCKTTAFSDFVLVGDEASSPPPPPPTPSPPDQPPSQPPTPQPPDQPPSQPSTPSSPSTPSTPAQPSPAGGTGKQGDLNKDNKVNVFDLSIMLRNWNKTSKEADLNNDGKVNIFDLSILLRNWNK